VLKGAAEQPDLGQVERVGWMFFCRFPLHSGVVASGQCWMAGGQKTKEETDDNLSHCPH
jgi:hypothetical protein